MKDFNLSDFQFNGKGSFSIAKAATDINDLYEKKDSYTTLLSELSEEMDALQNIMYAHNKHGLLIVFQAMDAAGKDGTMKAVFKNVHPLGLSFVSFKRPSIEELNHDYLWRCFKKLPERGQMTIFNRSYYEEVLVVKVHPEIVKNYQNLPPELTENLENLWKKRYADIVNFENYLNNNGVKVVKIFLNVSKKEQGKRLIERIEDIQKNWKFEEGDIKERAFWNDYMNAYETMINETATETSPWHIIPADDKKNMRLIVSQIIVEHLKSLKMEYPQSSIERQTELKKLIATIQELDKN